MTAHDEIRQWYLEIFQAGFVTVEDLRLREGLAGVTEASGDASEAMRQLAPVVLGCAQELDQLAHEARSTPSCDSATPDTSQPYFLDLINRIDAIAGPSLRST